MRKSIFYLLLSFLSLGVLICICFIFVLPNELIYNAIRLLLIFLCILFYKIHDFQKSKEFIKTSGAHINELKREYSYINTIVLLHAHLMFAELSFDFIKKYRISIDVFNNYLLDFEANIESFREKSLKKQIKNEFISVACVMDSLVSSWEIKTAIPGNVIFIEDLLKKNCQLAVAVALSLLNLSYEDLKNNSFVKRLIDLLILCYFNKQYGNPLIIENEAFILELLYDNFVQNK